MGKSFAATLPVFGQEIARQLGVRSIFAERVDGRMTLRRGFHIEPGERVLLAEDVTTTGGSVKEVMHIVEGRNSEIVAVTSVVDRSGGNARFGVPYHSLFQMDVTNFKPENCPMCLEGGRAIKPGSRGLK